MDFALRCNSLKCRVQLIERAVVTTCSHIFCIDCSNDLGLNSTPTHHRICPACQTSLSNPDDAVSTQLNPTEDYKTSVLSGLSPSTIMECAGRGLAFWSYQATQEIVYQEYTAKSVTDKFTNLNSQMDRVIHDANTEIDTLNQKTLALQVDKEKLQSDNTSLVAAFRDKSRKHQQTQELYDRLKHKEMAAATQSAALESVDEALGNVTSRHGVNQKPQAQPHSFMSHAQGQRDFVQLPLDHNGHEQVHSHQRSGGAGDSGNDGTIPPFLRRATPHGSRSTGSGNKNTTPAQHRTQLGPPPQGISQWYQQNQRGGTGMMNVSTQNQTPLQRNSHSNLNANINRNIMDGGGTSSRLKVGRQQGPRLGVIQQETNGLGSGYSSSQHAQFSRVGGAYF